MGSDSDSKNWKKLTDDELWDEFRMGQSDALSELYLRYYTRLYRYGMKFLQNEDAVKDGIQHLFLKLWNKKELIDDSRSVAFYLLKSLRRILLRQKNRNTSRYERNREYIRNFAESMTTIEEKIIYSEEKTERNELLSKAFKELTDRQKEVLTLRLQYGLKNEEIAEVIELSHQRVRNIIYEATQRLDEYISSF